MTQSLPRHLLPDGCVNVYIGLPGTRGRQPLAAPGPDLVERGSSAHGINEGTSRRSRVRRRSECQPRPCRLRRRRRRRGRDESAGGTSPGKGKAECAGLTSFGDLTGKTVSIYTSIVAPEDVPQKDSYKPFEACTGATVKYEGSKEFEAQLLVRVKGGNPPDIAIVPQPGLLNTLVTDTGKVKEAPETVVGQRRQVLGRGLEGLRHRRRQVLRRPAGRQREVLRLVLARRCSRRRATTVPTTLDELIALSDTIAANGHASRGAPASTPVRPPAGRSPTGSRTSCSATSVRTSTTSGSTHEIPFNDPQVVAALDRVGDDPEERQVRQRRLRRRQEHRHHHVPGRRPADPARASAPCTARRSFYAATGPRAPRWPRTATCSRSTCRPTTADGKPVLGGGEFVAAFADRPEVQAFQTYLSSRHLGQRQGQGHSGGGWVSANKGLDLDNAGEPDRQAAGEILQDPDAVFRFDGSDLMPARSAPARSGRR